MSEDDSSAEAKLRKLGKRLELACAKMPVLAPEHLDKVRKAVQERWQQEQIALEKEAAAQQQSGTAQTQKGKQQDKSKSSAQSQSHSEDHGHSH